MNKRYHSIQEMLDDIDPELGQDYRKHNNKLTTKLRRWYQLTKIRLQIWLTKHK